MCPFSRSQVHSERERNNNFVKDGRVCPLPYAALRNAEIGDAMALEVEVGLDLTPKDGRKTSRVVLHGD